MKKHFKLIILSLIFLVFMPSKIYAENQIDYVTDAAGIISSEEIAELDSRAREISEKYDCGVYIIVLDDFKKYVSSEDMAGAAREIFGGYDLGFNEDKSGILLLLSMAERDYYLVAHGYGNIAFTDFGKEYLADEFLDDLADDDWNSGFEDYLDTCDMMLKTAIEGRPIDVNYVPDPWWAKPLGIAICVLFGFLIGWIVIMILKSQLESVMAGSDADNFVSENGLTLSVETDVFTRKTESRTYSPKSDNSSDSSSSSGGTTVDSGGYSGSGGKF